VTLHTTQLPTPWEWSFDLQLKYNNVAQVHRVSSMLQTHTHIASFPGLHAQLLSLAVRKAGEGLDGFIT